MKPSKLLLATFATLSALSLGTTPGNAVDTADNRPSDNRSNITSQRFAADASQSSLKEIALSTRAAEQAQNPEVKTFAAILVSEHTKANETLKTLVSKETQLDQQLANSHQNDIDKVSANTSSFDKDYLDQVISDHRSTIELYQRASKELSDTDLQSFADTNLKSLEQYLTTAKGLRDSLEQSAGR